MCDSYNLETYTIIIPPEKAAEAVRDSGNVYLRKCPCRTRSGNCEQEDLNVCLLFEDAPEEDLNDAEIITKDKAFSILEMTRKRGDINQLFYRKDNKKYVEICNCCTCCCSILKEMEKEGDFTKYKSIGYLAETDSEKCSLCGECTDKCFFGARSIVDDKIILDDKLCFGCERCAGFCPEDAISLQADKVIRIPKGLHGKINSKIRSKHATSRLYGSG